MRAVRLGDVIREACQLVEPQVQARAHAFVLVPPPDEVEVWADREKLLQVLLNLLSNAVKFTPAGGRLLVDTPVRTDERRQSARRQEADAPEVEPPAA